jgi:hypothetical protein
MLEGQALFGSYEERLHYVWVLVVSERSEEVDRMVLAFGGVTFLPNLDLLLSQTSQT